MEKHILKYSFTMILLLSHTLKTLSQIPSASIQNFLISENIEMYYNYNFNLYNPFIFKTEYRHFPSPYPLFQSKITDHSLCSMLIFYF